MGQTNSNEVQNQATGPWQPSDGTPGQAAEPQPIDRFKSVHVEIGGEVAKVVFNNPGAKA